mmetsp:Transcript_5462/g.20992  ORF Transcript_5462/g.20992 Transcript_5462/m.20992 type:complete len:298 (-) Transcript_5462:29-922(-)
MEFPGLGSHCAVDECSVLDFLPFRCEGCERVHCLEHRTPAAHRCSAAAAEGAAEVVCPLCANTVPLGPDGDADRAVDAHIGSGCAGAAKKERCGARGCGAALGLLGAFACKFCSRRLCASHRLPEDHACAAMAAALAPAPPKGRDAEREARVQAFLVRQKEKRRRLGSLREAHARPPPKDRAAAVRRAAKGPAKVARPDRFVLEVLYPHGSGAAPRALYFHKAWPVGKALDVALEAASLENRNHLVPPEEKLHLISLRTGKPFPFSTSLAVLTYRKELAQADAVLIETLDNAAPDGE